MSAWVWAVGDHLWQSSAGLAIGWALARLLKKHAAAARYRIWAIASLKFLVPFSWLLALGRLVSWRVREVPTTSELPLFLGALSAPFSTATDVPRGPSSVSVDPLAVLAYAGLIVWMAGAVRHLVAWRSEWRRLAAATRSGDEADDSSLSSAIVRVSHAIGLRRSIRVAITDAAVEPGVFGIFNPVLLWPRHLLGRLSHDDIHSVVAHELTHVVRRDNLTAALHMLVEALFWFHPGVWWLQRRMVDERERACDQAVVDLTQQPEGYARSVLRTCELCIESSLMCVPGVSGADLRARIDAIVDGGSSRRMTRLQMAGLSICAASVVVAPLAAGVVTAPPRISVQQSAVAASAPPPIVIEVASIKPDNTDEPGPRFRPMTGGIWVTGITPSLMMEMAFSVRPFQIDGLPDWAKKERFNVQAKVVGVDGLLPHGLMPRVFERLLVDRFHLRSHDEQRENSVYELMVNGSQRKLIAAAGVRMPFASGERGYLSGTMTMDALTGWLMWRLERPIVNKTGLTDTYDIELIWTPDAGMAVGRALPAPPPPPPPPPPAAGGSAPLPTRRPPPLDPSSPSLFAALQEQLGLKLVSAKAPVRVLVVDGFDRPTVD